MPTRKQRKQLRKLKKDNQSKTQLDKLVWRFVDIISAHPSPNKGIADKIIGAICLACKLEETLYTD